MVSWAHLVVDVAWPFSRRLTALLVVLPALLGCSGEESTGLPISGTVTFQGKPLDQGTIHFAPADPSLPTSSGAAIADGRYAVPSTSGLAPGEYIVRISSGEPGTAAAEPAPGESGPPAKERIPAAFNVQTTLRAIVKKDDDNTFDYVIP